MSQTFPSLDYGLSYNKESLIATDEHPFYIENVGFVEAEDITIGDPLRLASGEVAVVESVEKEIQEELEPMYKLEIEELHTYYVGTERVLVHNTCGNGSKVDDIKQLIKNGKVVDNNIISSLDDNTQVVFRNDTGNNAHQIKPKGYFDKVDHYNVEIQTKTKAGKWKSKWSFHIIFDEKGNIIDTFD